MQLRLEAVSPAALARRAAESGATPPGRQIELELDDGLLGEADPHRLLQVLTNLIDNSLRHGMGAVGVAVSARGGRVVVAVSDEGQGIPADQAAQLFEPFARWATGAEGTGLGLAIARRIVEAHDGTLAYRPAAGGMRHAFVVELAEAAPEVSAASVRPRRRPGRS